MTIASEAIKKSVLRDAFFMPVENLTHRDYIPIKPSLPWRLRPVDPATLLNIDRPVL